jgi:hypothetical protein
MMFGGLTRRTRGGNEKLIILTYTVLLRTTQEKRLLRRPRIRWDDNIVGRL